MVAIRHTIRYLGFVVDVGLPGIDQVTHAMVNLEENPELWYIIELSSSRYQHTLQDSVGRYFRTVFSLSVNIWSAYKLTGRLDRNQPIPGADTRRLREYAEYLREVDRADKLKAAAPEFPRIRRAIHGSLFCPVGTKQNDTLHLEWKGAATPTQIFFWTKCEFEASSLKGATGLPFGTVMTAEAESPTTRLLPEQFEGMAVSFGLMQPPCSWQDLYLSALIKGSEIQDFIDIGMATMGNRDAAPSVRGNKKASGYRASQLLDAMTQGATIGVVAPSGCGKSTVLRWIADKGISSVRMRMPRGLGSEDMKEGTPAPDIQSIRFKSVLTPGYIPGEAAKSPPVRYSREPQPVIHRISTQKMNETLIR